VSWRAEVRLAVGELALDVTVEGDGVPVALIGPNGSGKTTLLRTIAGAHRPDAGRVRLQDRVLFDSARRVDLPPEQRRVGYVPQGFGLFPHLSVLDNVGFGLVGRGRAERREAAAPVLEQMGIAHLAQRTPGALSGGEQQRVALARALMVDPAILLLDEPLSALDASARRAMRAHLAGYLAERGGPSVVVTHDARDVFALGAHVYVLERGRVVQQGAAAEVAAAPCNDFVAEFFFDQAG